MWGDRKYEADIIEFISLPFILSYAYKWLDEKKIHVRALPDFAGYSKNRECDKALLASLYALIDTADIVCAHNGDKFDLRFSNTRALIAGLLPPDPYKSIDTLKIARKHFKFPSNKLDDLGQFLGVGRKLPHTGKDLWLRCMGGHYPGEWPHDPKAWGLMCRYNVTDVALLERVFIKMRPFTTTHPNLSFYSRDFNACPVCQSKHAKHTGWHYYKLGKRQRNTCLDCGHRYVTGAIIRDDAPLRSNRGR